MLKTLRDLAARLVPAPAGAATAAEDDEHTLRLAAAVLLVEVMRAEGDIDPLAETALLGALRAEFGLDADEAARLAELAEQTSRASTDLFTFTGQIDRQFDMAAKLRMIERLWGIAYADGRLGDHERHTLWRIADLLHVPHGAYVNARLRAQAQAAVPPGGVNPANPARD
ncbi:MAG: TerB family tellurite resistance protein [Rubrivivax sp.]